ncbi:NAD(P)H-dependent oxidoreductase [Pelagibacterium flavum]|uniref:NAD(P)H-dependent oxidoreductase n=1 Tax=Pelagibacterium flavum TaxID=2984530 RepID=A0ABY6ILZ3_9HYPH|nr:NAD(P)H-dependent oxidoreductase [Pelagibacterium sp. YIM 151497]UYQ70760.1 NAD(P)H-dependent oxidoreductase [Pelagibacterium sp. YIM 151497]|tara:strand:- start:570 stop:1226 length:657 start_codon:yes stop_codon:yes gene_type:complete
MPKLYRLDASIRADQSVTRSLADAFAAGADDAFSDVIHREVGTTPLPAPAWRDAVTSMWTPPEQLTTGQENARALAAELADELISADVFLFAIPLYNFGVAHHAKAWIDLVLSEPRFVPGPKRPLEGRPGYLMTARGGGYGPGTPRHGWDHSTPYLQRILKDQWGLDLTSVEVELTLADVTPAMEALRPLAAENLREGLAQAKRLGATAAQQSPSNAA